MNESCFSINDRSLILICITTMMLSGCADEKDATPESREDKKEFIDLERGESAPFVMAFERYHRHQDGRSLTAGRILKTELACASCHHGEIGLEKEPLDRVAPDLSRVADRVNPAYLQSFIADPHGVKPGTTMPALLDATSEENRRRQAKVLTHFLVSLRPNQFKPLAPDQVAADRGANLYHSRGCIACHAPQQEAAEEPPRDSVPLPDLVSKYDHDGLERFLLDPLHTRPSGRMPKLLLKNREASDIAHYLLRETRVPSALSYILYTGWLDDLDKLKEKQLIRTGAAKGLDLEIAQRKDAFAIRFDGWLDIPQAGEWSFYLTSDDGSRLWLDEQLVVDNNGRRRPPKAKELAAKKTLTAGVHAFRLEYFQHNKEKSLKLDWEGPGQVIFRKAGFSFCKVDY